MNLQGMKQRVSEQYDRMLAVAILLVLLGSVLYLAVRIGTISMLRDQFTRELETMQPAHEFAETADPGIFETAMSEFTEPTDLGNMPENMSLLVPQTRVMCVDCRRPIPFEAEVCPFCLAAQPEEEWDREDYDGDGDGMWDSWEKTYGLDPADAADAGLDNDGDGFLNIEEFMANPRTDPSDPKSYPPPEARLRLVKIEADPFRLRFKSRIKLPDNSYKFAINTRDNKKTYFAKLGELVEGFVLESFDERYEKSDKGGLTRTVDVSVLTLKRGDKLIRLVMGRDYSYNEYIVTLNFPIENRTIVVKPGQVFELKGNKYVLSRIDNALPSVVVKRESDGTEFEVRRGPNHSNNGGEKESPLE